MHRRQGFWAPTTLRIDRDLNRIRGRAPDEVVDFFATTYGPEATAELQAAMVGRYSEQRVLWDGVVHNAVALGIAGLLGASLWLNFQRLKPRLVGLLPSERRRRRGLCPRCGYDIVGLDRCPECGAEAPLLRKAGAADAVAAPDA